MELKFLCLVTIIVFVSICSIVECQCHNDSADDICSVNGSLVSISDDLSMQTLQMNCFTFKVRSHQVTWMIGSSFINQPASGSVLLDSVDEIYKHSINITRSFTPRTIITCHTDVNGETDDEDYTIKSASSPPANPSATIVCCTSVSINWTPLSSGVNGYIIVYNGGQPVIINGQDTSNYTLEGLSKGTTYQISVYSYYDIPSRSANSVSILLDAGICSVNGSLVSISDDLSMQTLQMNCFTFRVPSHQVTWMIDSDQPANGSVLLDSVDEIYKHSVNITRSFTPQTIITCHTDVNGETDDEDYAIRSASSPPANPSATIVSSTSVSISWTPLSSDVNGYIIVYNGGQPVIINGQDTSNYILEGLSKGTTYQISVYSYCDIPSGSANNVSILLDVPVFTSIQIIVDSPIPTVVTIILDAPITTTLDNYTVVTTRLCDNVVSSMTFDGTLTNLSLEEFSSGLQYTISITPVNMLGEGMETIRNITLQENGFKNLSVESSNTTSVQLSWSTLPSVSIDSYSYEVGFAVISSDRDCSSIVLDTLPQNYTSFTNTTNRTVQVNGLIADTCYVFGVRVLCLSVTAASGRWTIQILQTDEVQTFSSSLSNYSSAIVIGVVFTIVAIVIIIVIIVMLGIVRRSRWKFNVSTTNRENDSHEMRNAVHYAKSSAKVDIDNEP